MGANLSNIKGIIKDEFNKVKSPHRLYAILDELIKIKQPSTGWKIVPAHLATLYVADFNKDGRFTLDEVHTFMDLIAYVGAEYRQHEFCSQVQAYCTQQLYRSLATPEGRRSFVEWFVRLVTADKQLYTLEAFPGRQYVDWDLVHSIYTLLDIKYNEGLDFQSFFDLLQQAGEDQQMLDVNDDEVEDEENGYVPLDVIRDFVAHMYEGMQRVIDTMETVAELPHSGSCSSFSIPGR